MLSELLYFVFLVWFLVKFPGMLCRAVRKRGVIRIKGPGSGLVAGFTGVVVQLAVAIVRHVIVPLLSASTRLLSRAIARQAARSGQPTQRAPMWHWHP